MLTCACALAGAPYVLGVDIDASSLLIASENASQFEELPVEFLHADVQMLPLNLAKVETLPQDHGQQQCVPSTSRTAPVSCSANDAHVHTPGSNFLQSYTECDETSDHQAACMMNEVHTAAECTLDHKTRQGFDIAVCNPPFGTWTKGADTAFLAAAFQVLHLSNL
jgi:predicted RNA methylase